MLVHSPQKQLILRSVCMNLLQQSSADETLPNVVFGGGFLTVDDEPDNHFQRDPVKSRTMKTKLQECLPYVKTFHNSKVDVRAFKLLLLGEQNYKPIRHGLCRKTYLQSLFESITPANDLSINLEHVM